MTPESMDHSVNLTAMTPKLFKYFVGCLISDTDMPHPNALFNAPIYWESTDEHGYICMDGTYPMDRIYKEEEFEYLEVQEHMRVPWKALDLDGCLAEYDSHTIHDVRHIGKPIQRMVDQVKVWIAEGWKIKIFTARAVYGPLAVKAVQDWLEKECGLPRLEVTNIKDGLCIAIYDDRCVQVEANTGRLLGEEAGL